jgi:hypothetical protein
VGDGSVTGDGAFDDTLVVTSTAFDLTSTTLSSVEILAAGTTSATTFTLDPADLTGLLNGTTAGIQGSTGAGDILTILGATFDLSSVALSSIEILTASTTDATTFTVDQADLAPGGAMSAPGINDTIQLAGGNLDLSTATGSSTALVGIEHIIGTAAGEIIKVGINTITDLRGGPGADIIDMAGATGGVILDQAVPGIFDSITGFVAGGSVDIHLSLATYSSLPGLGPLLPGNYFVGAPPPPGATDFIIYDPATGGLFYDPDGSGAAPGVQIAAVGVGGGYTPADFLIVP